MMLAALRRAARGRRAVHTAASGGFAGIQGLQQPADWFKLAHEASARCDELVRRAVEEAPSEATVQTLDDISDALCQVLDAAEFCRNAHADPEWRSAAQRVCIDLGGYVHQLNTHYSLYTALSSALERHYAAEAAAAQAAGRGAAAGTGSFGSSPSGSSEGSSSPSGSTCSSTQGSSSTGGSSSPGSGWSEEAVLVARMLKRDFEQYGVHLSGHSRDRMTDLVQRAHVLGMRITNNIVSPDHVGSLMLEGGTAGAVKHLPYHLQRSFRPLADKRSGRILGVSAPADTQLLTEVLRWCPDEEVRQKAHLAYNQLPTENATLLDELVAARHEMAGLMGFPSFAHYKLDGVTLANRPEAVAPFLEGLREAIRPKCEQEMGRLQALKRQRGGGPVGPWDRAYLTSLATGTESSHAVDLSQLPAYFQLERVVEGLSGLLRRLTGVTLEERPLGQGEGWAPGVRKLVAVHETEGELGVVYLDLYRRPHKFPGSAHFTLRCGRRASDGSYQTPVVALVGSLAPQADMSHSEVETLFHEFGHAVHSLLSRTRFQHLAGTRGPLDTVEIPSHTLESFASDPRVLATFARHRTTGEPLPRGLVDALHERGQQFVGLDYEQQLLFCAVDQVLHGPDPPTGQRAQQAVGELVERYSSLGHVPGTLPQIRFNHLVGYGATYYAYLYAQCLSANIWQRHLAADPLSRTAGEALRHGLLEPGGAQEAHAMVEGVLGPGVMHSAAGGWYPDARSMLVQRGLLV